jgi:type VI secretion system secreted protein Hcp
MAEMFLELDNVKGETLDDEFAKLNAVEIRNWNWKATNNVKWDVNQGGQSTKVIIEHISLDKICDKASATLHQCCVTGKHIKKGKITCRKKDGETKFTYLVVDLTDIMVDYFEWTGDGENPALNEKIGLSFAEYKISYKIQGDSGTAEGASDFGFNVQRQSGSGHP